MGGRSRPRDRRNRPNGEARRDLGVMTRSPSVPQGSRSPSLWARLMKARRSSTMGLRSIRTWDGHGTSAPWPGLSLVNPRSRSSTQLAPFATGLRIRRYSLCRQPRIGALCGWPLRRGFVISGNRGSRTAEFLHWTMRRRSLRRACGRDSSSGESDGASTPDKSGVADFQPARLCLLGGRGILTGGLKDCEKPGCRSD